MSLSQGFMCACICLFVSLFCSTLLVPYSFKWIALEDFSFILHQANILVLLIPQWTHLITASLVNRHVIWCNHLLWLRPQVVTTELGNKLQIILFELQPQYYQDIVRTKKHNRWHLKLYSWLNGLALQIVYILLLSVWCVSFSST